MHHIILFLLNIILVSSLLILSAPVLAQDNQFGLWGAWFNNVKFNEKWGMNNDIQFRAGRNWKESALFLIRPGVNYYVRPNQTASIGYATTLTLHHIKDQSRLTEHRIWEQYIITNHMFELPFQHRFRLEQRFLKRSEETHFTQRARYFIRGILPLNTILAQTFNKGAFIALQNELFFNIQHKNVVNQHFFDQNRAYTAFGYRFSPSYDLEMGYMNQFLKRSHPPSQFTHILQVAFYTRL
ncbi:DUF2490 domain-containing protein [Olivibacter ginsenosidimutans]|uniref:DUF2490 domain-containing protein n=1 Tax=Olivibacter ginsenosidimutans TaxID=1176537 RepID=A0ABP9AGN8_9SPHI